MLRREYEIVENVEVLDQKLDQNRDFREDEGFWARQPRYWFMRSFAAVCMASVGAGMTGLYWEYEGNPFTKLVRPLFHQEHPLPVPTGPMVAVPPSPTPESTILPPNAVPPSPNSLPKDPALRSGERRNSKLFLKLFEEKYGPAAPGHGHGR